MRASHPTSLRVISFAAALALAAPGCGDDGGNAIDGPPGGGDAGPPDAVAADAPPVSFTASGTVVGPNAAAGPVVVVFIVSVGDDYSYKFGDGASTGDAYSVGLRGDPPGMARNQVAGTTDLGIGVMALLPPGTSIPDGVVQGDPPTVGISPRHAIIYRGATDTGADPPWADAFPLGYSCGVCVDQPSGFDTFEPIECTELVIDTAAVLDFCNFT